MTELASAASQFLPSDYMGNPGLCVAGTARANVDRDVDQVFEWFVDLDISRVLNGYGPLPGVDRTVGQSGPWDEPGQTRQLEMSGGITATQQILVVRRPVFFAYRVAGFNHVLDWMTHGAEARWWFEELPHEGTRMTWTYTFWPRFVTGKLAIYPVISTLWTWYMRVTIQEMKHLAELEID